MSMSAGRRLCVAPMMDRTDRHCRFFLRQLSRHAWLYTEMITAAAVLGGDRRRLLEFRSEEHPVALQLGGGDPGQLADAARVGEAAGYDEINLNVGCPSGRVQAGEFGCALMLEPERVARCVAAMRAAVDVPVTVKTRIGVDDRDDYAFLRRFVDAVAEAGCRTVIVHARKAWLKGLSPKQNRTLPPLDYGRVHRLKDELPELEIIINGGFTDARVCAAQLDHVDGVMLGRAAYQDPFLLAELDARLFGGAPTTREAALQGFLAHAGPEVERGTPLKAMTRHLLGLYAGQPGARRWRRALGELPAGHAGLAALRRVSETFGPTRRGWEEPDDVIPPRLAGRAAHGTA